VGATKTDQRRFRVLAREGKVGQQHDVANREKQEKKSSENRHRKILCVYTNENKWESEKVRRGKD